MDPPGTGNERTYLFDAFNRMVCSRQGANCTNSSGKITFALDALDRVLTRTKDGVTTTTTYQGTGEVSAKTVTGVATTTYASTLGGAPIAQSTGSGTRFLLTDLHADVVGLVDTAAAITATRAFDPWGTPLGITGTETSWFGYQGDPTDPDTRQVDMTTRWYEASLGRFSSRDVLFGDLQEPLTLNQFAYAGGSPVTNLDPTGMSLIAGNDQEAGDDDRYVYNDDVNPSSTFCSSCSTSVIEYSSGYASRSHVGTSRPVGPTSGPSVSPRATITQLHSVAGSIASRSHPSLGRLATT